MMEGDELLEQIKACRPETPIVILSGHLTEELQDRLMQRGAVQVLGKPCPMELLLVAIREAIRLPGPTGSGSARACS